MGLFKGSKTDGAPREDTYMVHKPTRSPWGTGPRPSVGGPIRCGVGQRPSQLPPYDLLDKIQIQNLAERRRSSLLGVVVPQDNISREDLVMAHRMVCEEEERVDHYVSQIQNILKELSDSYEQSLDSCAFCSTGEMEMMIEETVRQHNVLSARQYDAITQDQEHGKISTITKKLSLAAERKRFYAVSPKGDIKKEIMEKEDLVSMKTQRAQELDNTVQKLADKYLLVRNYFYLTRYRYLRQIIEEATEEYRTD